MMSLNGKEFHEVISIKKAYHSFLKTSTRRRKKIVKKRIADNLIKLIMNETIQVESSFFVASVPVTREP